MRRYLETSLLVAVLLWTAVLNIYHAGVMPPPEVDLDATAHAEWFDKTTHGLNHMVLVGPPYARGVKAGELTTELLLKQEEALTGLLHTWIPSRFLLQAFVLGAIAWFKGVEKYIEPAHLEEMYGTSHSVSTHYNYLVDPYTRQIAYHGLHEVGQMMVDSGVSMGCTVLAWPEAGSWIIGRNFDFEGGRIFDNGKIVKWTFPDTGHAFVSVIWAGMVGAVTGVNQKGLYVSINAAGSSGFRRVGTPSTLVLMKVLQEASNTNEAIEIFKQAQMFITDIFVLTDASGALYRIEKSPDKTAVVRLKGPSVVANHLIAPEFMQDSVNKNRMKELTTLHRQQRGEELLARIPADASHEKALAAVLAGMRDKGLAKDGEPLHLHNRMAIDALIATHAVIYDGPQNTLYVSKGPALAGPFLGYDLTASFKQRRPVPAGELPRDPQVSDEAFHGFVGAAGEISSAHRYVKLKRCAEALDILERIDPRWREQSIYYHALGDTRACHGELEKARAAWKQALALEPAYDSKVQLIKERLAQ